MTLIVQYQPDTPGTQALFNQNLLFVSYWINMDPTTPTLPPTLPPPTKMKCMYLGV